MTFRKSKAVVTPAGTSGVGRLTGMMLAVNIAAAPAAAQTPTPTPLATLLNCHTDSNDARRLACFDRAASTLAAAITDGDLVVTDREQRAALAKQDFGRTAGAPGDRRDARDAERPALPARIDATIARAGRLPTGRWMIILDNGARWQQADDRTLARDPHAGMKITITHAALGSYLGKVDGQVAIRVRRID